LGRVPSAVHQMWEHDRKIGPGVLQRACSRDHKMAEFVVTRAEAREGHARLLRRGAKDPSEGRRRILETGNLVEEARQMTFGRQRDHSR